MTLIGFPDHIVLQGLKFTGGDAREASGFKGGGAIYATWPGTWSDTSYSGPLHLLECVFEDNHAQDEGGAVSMIWWDAQVSKCRFVNNHAHGDPQLGANDQPGSASGGAIALSAASLIADRTLFSGNSVADAGDGYGGAISSGEGVATVKCVNCTFEGNSCVAGTATLTEAAGRHGQGGAIYARKCGDVFHKPEFPPILTNCVFRGNAAGLNGGALCLPDGVEMNACTVGANSVSAGSGGGVYLGGPTNGVEATIANSIMWGNAAAPLEEDEDDPAHQFVVDVSPIVVDLAIGYSCIRGMDLEEFEDHNIAADPRFADGDLRLRWCSPARSAGNSVLLPEDEFDLDEDLNWWEPHSTDLDGKLSPRVKGAGLDMGAFEHEEPAETGCAGDLDNSGAVDGADLGQLLGAWGPCPDCAADIALCDGVVDGADLGQLLGAWGACPGGMMAMSSGSGGGGGGGSPMALLIAYLGAESAEEAGMTLGAMDFQQMSALLEIFLGS